MYLINSSTILDDFVVFTDNSIQGSSKQTPLKQLIKGHLEQLLNTRRPYLPDAPEFVLSQYGLPDLSQFNPQAEEDCALLCHIIQNIIATFEPRLTDLQVSILETTQESDPGKVSLRIFGKLTQQQTESIEFISWLNLATHQLCIEESL